ncbi:hypothetical protein [Sphingopyxis sp. KK2]|uniref:hypothetical protein n=1 Tax=Sphingopyxis sp. KK2 TaxID=1855727 RepID=UPI00097E5BCD|nr:hypothetical protein [Sphingopyxis sp. KK2]
MERLEQLFGKWRRRSGARSWIGPRPVGRVGQIPRILAAKIGYPSASVDPFEHGGLVALDRAQAANVLAVSGTVSLAYSRWVPREGALRDAREALREMADDVRFLSNGLWSADANWWNPMSAATFDCGLIGFDADHAFIYWVEEED